MFEVVLTFEYSVSFCPEPLCHSDGEFQTGFLYCSSILPFMRVEVAQQKSLDP